MKKYFVGKVRSTYIVCLFDADSLRKGAIRNNGTIDIPDIPAFRIIDHIEPNSFNKLHYSYDSSAEMMTDIMEFPDDKSAILWFKLEY